MKITLIAAVGKNLELGYENQLLWQLPGDLPRFKQLTMGHPIIMGRKTFDSIGRPLPGRRNIVLSQNTSLQIDNVDIASSVEHAIELAQLNDCSACFVIGGGEIYKLFLPFAQQLELTMVKDTPTADAFFPDFNLNDFNEISRIQNEANGLQFDYVTLVRKE